MNRPRAFLEFSGAEEKHLGLQRQGQEPVVFNWRYPGDPEKAGMTVWAVFPKDTKYFDPSRSGFMTNFIVENLDGLLGALGKLVVWPWGDPVRACCA